MSVYGYLTARWSLVAELFVQHLLLVVGSIVLAGLIGVSAGVVASRRKGFGDLLMGGVNTLYSVPSLSAVAFLTALVGIGTVPAVVATVAYALLPIVRSTLTGLREVDPAVRRAAAAMGMSTRHQLVHVELPLAWPVILSGLRVASVLTAGIATIAAYVDGPGLGRLLFQGLKAIGSTFAVPQTVTAVIGIVLVALVVDALINHVLGRFTTPRGLR